MEAAHDSDFAGRPSLLGAVRMVLKHPSLPAIEILWRWLAGAPILAFVAWHANAYQQSTPLATSTLASATVFRPVEAVTIFESVTAPVLQAAHATLVWFVPLALVYWLLCGAIGRMLLLRRLDPALHPRPLTLFAFALLRVLGLTAFLLAWLMASLRAGRAFITTRGADPNLVLCFAAIVCSALLLFVLWSVLIWWIDLATALSAVRGTGIAASLRTAFHHPKLRSAMVENNFVMGIVKIALLVLAMVFSACPLPFQSVETREFLATWWIGVAIWYLLTSNIFHTARLAAGIRLTESFLSPPATPSPGKTASDVAGPAA